jgi:hypothetical protein
MRKECVADKGLLALRASKEKKFRLYLSEYKAKPEE